MKKKLHFEIKIFIIVKDAEYRYIYIRKLYICHENTFLTNKLKYLTVKQQSFKTLLIKNIIVIFNNVIHFMKCV